MRRPSLRPRRCFTERTQIESPFVCCSVDQFASDDKGTVNLRAFEHCEHCWIKLSGDDDKSHRNSSSLRGLAHESTGPEQIADCGPKPNSIPAAGQGVGIEEPEFRHVSRGFQQQLKTLGPDFQSCINDHSGEMFVRSCEV